MKKLFSTIICACICVCILTSCSGLPGANKAVLDISGMKPDNEIFLYYFDKVSSSPKKYSLNENSTQREYIDTVVNLCTKYVAVNSEFEGLNLSLDVGHKTKIANAVSDEWRIYSKYYDSIGVSKQSITKIHTVKEKGEMLFLAYYDEGGSNAVPNDELKKIFYDNYVAFNSINGYLTITDEEGKSKRLSEDEINALKTKFNGMLEKINNGESIEEVGNAYAKEQGSTATGATVNVCKKGSTEYPAGFFDKVFSLENNKAAVVETGDYLFLLMRTDMTENDETFFDSYRIACLKELKKEEFEKSISATASSYTKEENSKAINKLIQRYSACVEK